ncbi:hypothetical protein ACFY3M_15255 [Streptomyces mirabilis]|uniref:hypothetical protein n=1 Tax=Streptomyces mirabilis TaxID=68239 RepID=UPI0036B4FF32
MMTAQHARPGGPGIARPERTPAALRCALAQVAPHRLAEMERDKDEAIALAAATDRLGPIVQFLETWAVAVEIARNPALAARLRAAEHAARTIDRNAPVWRAAMDEIHAVHAVARQSLDRE